jgi:predicted dehydrogenase
MALRLAILGLETAQREWLEAVDALRASGEIELVGIGHESLAGARDVAGVFRDKGEAPVFDDLRQLLKDAAPQVILMDRPATATVEFLLACAGQEIGVLSLGPPVETLAEAQALSEALEVRTRLLYVWPRFADAPASAHCAQADEFVRPIRFASATWLGINYALAKAMQSGRLGHGHSATLPVRSLSVLAWDALASVIRLMGVPASVYAAIRGTTGSSNSFADLSGAASVTLRFLDDAAASLTLCDRAPGAAGETAHGDLSAWQRRDLMLWGAGGTLKLNTQAYEFRDADGELIDAGPPPASAPSISPRGDAAGEPLKTLRRFLEQYALPPSPHRGWEHHLEEIAATMEALVVSHRTGQAESPERLRKLRR